MTLAASADISIGGTVATRSIEQEIGSPTFTTPFNQQAAMNDTSLRTLSGTTAGTQVSFSTFYGKSSAVYWLAALGTSSALDDSYFDNLAVASSGDIYTTGAYYSGALGSTRLLTTMFNSSGTLQWQKLLNSIGNYGSLMGAGVDSSGNIYVTGWATIVDYDIVQAKYNSSGTLQWQKYNHVGPLDNLYSRDGCTDASGNVYYTCNEETGRYGYTIKRNSAGTLQWQRRISLTSAMGIAVDSSGNVYTVGTYYVTTSAQGLYVIKRNSAGTLQWQKRLTTGTNTMVGLSIALDSSANVYVSGWDDTAGGAIVCIAKYNTSGTLQWQRKTNYSLSVPPSGITADPAGNVYISVSNYILKWNTSGTFQWQRHIVDTLNSSETQAQAFVDWKVGVYSDGTSVYLTLDYAGGTQLDMYGAITGYDYSIAGLSRIPVDGSHTGSKTFTIGASTVVTYATDTYFTESAGTCTDSTPTYTDVAGILGDATATMTDAAGVGTAQVGSL